MSQRTKYASEIAEKIITQLKEGTAPWVIPWEPGSQLDRPMNPVTGLAYRGMNSIILAMAQPNNDSRWCTFKQAKEIDAYVKSGSKGTTISYWKVREKKLVRDEKNIPILDEYGEKQYEYVRTNPTIYYATVFHASQIEGMPPLERKPEKKEWERHEEAENILKKSKASIKHDQSNNAFYRPSEDSIHLPKREQFKTPDNYYATALHELGHWTGHETRLNRDISNPFGSEAYAKEELRAEMSSFMLGSELGIGHDPGQHVAYIKSWVKILENDSNEIFRAARDAEKITNYVLGLVQEKVQELSVNKESTNDMQPKTHNNEQIASEKTWLFVSFEEKDKAKQYGAKWDKNQKLWYAPKGTNLKPLTQWLAENKKIEKSLTDPLKEFTEALKLQGLKINGLAKMDGKLHRVAVEGSNKGKLDGAYKGFLDGHPAGFIQNFKTGYKSNWKASGQRIDSTQLAKIDAETKAKLRDRELEKQAGYEKKSKEVTKEFKSLPYAPTSHPYMIKKELNIIFGAKLDKKNNIVIPLSDKKGKIWSLQRIGPNGFKGYEKNSKVQGVYHVLGGRSRLAQEPSTDPVLISTGFATSGSIFMATGKSVVATFQDSNLKEVAQEMKALFPDREIAILGDDDRHNTEKGLPNSGREKAIEAAELVGGKAIFPRFSNNNIDKNHTDFSDLHREAGLEAVKYQIEKEISHRKIVNIVKDQSHTLKQEKKIDKSTHKQKEPDLSF